MDVFGIYIYTRIIYTKVIYTDNKTHAYAYILSIGLVTLLLPLTLLPLPLLPPLLPNLNLLLDLLLWLRLLLSLLLLLLGLLLLLLLLLLLRLPELLELNVRGGLAPAKPGMSVCETKKKLMLNLPPVNGSVSRVSPNFA